MRVFITGGSGQLGRAICSALLERGDEVVVLTRDLDKARKVLSTKVELIEGDPCYEVAGWQSQLAGFDAVISLAGEPMDGQNWDARFRQVLHDSRIDSTRYLAEGILKLAEADRPKVFVATSSVNYYSFAEIEMFDDDEFDEAATGGETFLSYLCWDWEDETKCLEPDIRVVTMRLGTVLGPRTRAFKQLCAPFSVGIGGPIGKGRQWLSWVHIADVAGAYLHAIDSELQGPVNLVSPGAVRSSEMAQALGNVLGKRSWFRTPGFVVRRRMGALSEYVLKGRQAVPKALIESGYEFKYPDVEPALRELTKR
ncbi:MAG: TIGR01777 family oxidoreductase [Kofleriaceae bacterium]|nr:TIGR01777 family oxidoreductase [Kofleriaceae bacterium]